MNAMNPIEQIRSSHPAFEDMTQENVYEYFALVHPFALLDQAVEDGATSMDPAIECVASDLGQRMLQFFQDKPEDTRKHGAICDFLMNQVLITRDPAIHQVVIFDFAMDTRAYRLHELADCSVFELELNPTIMHEKERCLQTSGLPLLAKERHVIEADPRKEGWDDLLFERGFDPDTPTSWILGIYLAYTPPDAAVRMLSMIQSLSAPHSQIYADVSMGHIIHLTTEDASNITTVQLFDLDGDSASIFVGLADWRVELLMRRDSELRYYGSMWDPETMEKWRTTKPEKATVGPWFAVRFSKAETEDVYSSGSEKEDASTQPVVEDSQ